MLVVVGMRTFSKGYMMVYGALKNCSNTTYIPRAISLIKKYFAALSSDDPPSSQVCGRPIRNPVGGGGRGVACRWAAVVENCEDIIAGVKNGCWSSERDGRPAMRPSDLMDAIAGAGAILSCLWINQLTD